MYHNVILYYLKTEEKPGVHHPPIQLCHGHWKAWAFKKRNSDPNKGSFHCACTHLMESTGIKIGQSTWRGSDHLTNRLGTNSDAVIKCLQNAILNASSANWLSSPSSSSSLSSPFVKTLRDQCQNLPRLLQIVYLFELSKDTYSVSPGHMSWDNFQQNAT